MDSSDNVESDDLEDRPNVTAEYETSSENSGELNNRLLDDEWWNAARDYQQEREELENQSHPNSSALIGTPADSSTVHPVEADSHAAADPRGTATLGVTERMRQTSDDSEGHDSLELNEDHSCTDDLNNSPTACTPMRLGFTMEEHRILNENMGLFPELFPSSQAMNFFHEPTPSQLDVALNTDSLVTEQPVQILETLQNQPERPLVRATQCKDTVGDRLNVPSVRLEVGAVNKQDCQASSSPISDESFQEGSVTFSETDLQDVAENNENVADNGNVTDDEASTGSTEQSSNDEPEEPNEPENSSNLSYADGDASNGYDTRSSDTNQNSQNSSDVHSTTSSVNSVHHVFSNASTPESAGDSDESSQQQNGATSNPKVTLKLDGLMVAGDTWNIVTIDGTVHLFSLFTVTSEPAMHYKGLPHAIEANYRYEIAFANVDNCTLSLLVTSNVDRSTYNGKGRHPVVYKDMCNAFLNIIRESMEISQSESFTAYLANGGTGIAIKRQDWEIIGNIVAERLRNYRYHQDEAEEDSSVTNLNFRKERAFPDGAKFCFLLKKFGHDTSFETIVYPNPYPHIQVNHKSTTRVIVHSAHDYTLENDLLFFNEKHFKHLYKQTGVLPTHEYNVGIIPKVSNFLYMNMPVNNYNVSGMLQYTRLFHEVHRNPYDFFRYSVITKSMLKGYVSKLNQTTLWKDITKDQTLAAIRSGSLKRIESAIFQMLSSKLPIPARCEFVWSYPLHQSNEIEEEEIHLNSIVDILQKAFKDCSDFKLRYDVCRTELFIVHKRRIVIRYLRNLIKTLFGTISFNVMKLESLFAIKDTGELYDASVVFKDKDFADTAVAEAMLTRLLRGDLCKFPNLLEKCILIKRNAIENERQQEERLQVIRAEDDEEEPEDDIDSILRTCWPFNRDFIWRSETGLVRTNIPITKIFREFPDILGGKEQGQHMINLARDFSTWKSTFKNSNVKKIEEVTIQLFRTLSAALLQRLLAINADTAIPSERINSKAADNENALRNIWNYGKVSKTQNVTVKFSVSAYKTICEDTSKAVYKKLAPLILFMTVLRNKLSDRFDGGTQRSLSIALDELMLRSQNPFMYRLPKIKLLPIFIPVSFMKPDQAYVSIYHRSFYALYKKRIGERGIHVERFMEALVEHISKLSEDQRDEINALKIFKFIYKLLDTERIASNTKLFKDVPPDLRYILLNVNQGVFAIPIARPRKQKSIHQDLELPANQDRARKCLRSDVRRHEEELARQLAEQKRLEEQARIQETHDLVEQLIRDYVPSKYCVTEHEPDYQLDAIFEDRSEGSLSSGSSDPPFPAQQQHRRVISSDSESPSGQLIENTRAAPSDFSDESQCDAILHKKKPFRRAICSGSDNDTASDSEFNPKPKKKICRRIVSSDSDNESLVEEESSAESSPTYDADSDDDENCSKDRRVATPLPFSYPKKTRNRVYTLDSDNDEDSTNSQQSDVLQVTSNNSHCQIVSRIPLSRTSSVSDGSQISRELNTYLSAASDTNGSVTADLYGETAFVENPGRKRSSSRTPESNVSILSHDLNTYSSPASSSSSVRTTRSVTRSIPAIAATTRKNQSSGHSSPDSGCSLISNVYNTYSSSNSNGSNSCARSVTQKLQNIASRRQTKRNSNFTRSVTKNIQGATNQKQSNLSCSSSSSSDSDDSDDSDDSAITRETPNTYVTPGISRQSINCALSSSVNSLVFGSCTPRANLDESYSSDSSVCSSSTSSSCSTCSVTVQNAQRTTISTSGSSSDTSLVSGGFLYRAHKRKRTGTVYDRKEILKNSLGVVPSPKPRNPPLTPRFRKPWTHEEDCQVFEFLSEHHLMLYMFGMNVHKLMEKMKIVDRSYLSLQSRVSKIARVPHLHKLIGIDLAQEVTEFVAEIDTAKHCNMITLAELECKFNLRFL